MRRFVIVIFVVVLLGSIFASDSLLYAAPPAAKNTPTPTVKPTRTPKPTRTTTPTPELTQLSSPTDEPTLAPTETATPGPLQPTDTPNPSPSSTAASPTSQPPTSVPATPSPLPATATPSPAPPTATPAPSIDNAAVDNVASLDAAPTSPGAMSSQIIIINPDTTGAATVGISIRNSVGAEVYATTVPVSKNGARVVTLPSLGTFNGSAVISSDKNVQAMVTDANASQTARDLYEGSSATAQAITLPLFRHLAQNTGNSIIAVQNTSNTAANVTLSYYDQAGNVTALSPTSVQPLASVYFNTNSISFPTSPFIGSAKITADQNIAAAEQTLFAKDTASFRGLTASDEGTTLYVPVIERRVNVNGVPNAWSETYVRNNGIAATNISVQYYSSAGAPVGNPVTHSGVQPNGLAQFITKDLGFEFLGSFTGSAQVTASQPISLYSLEALGKGGLLYGVSGLTDAQTGTRFACGDTFRSATQNSKINILNTGGAPATVRVRLFDKNSGANLKAVKFTNIPSHSVLTVSLADATYAAAGTSFEGLAVVNSLAPAQPLAVSVNTPYSSAGKSISITAYDCSRF